MSAYRIGQRYAKSLLDFAGERDKTEKVTDDIRMLEAVINESRELRVLLHSPIVKVDQKRKVLETIFNGRVEKETLAFIMMLVSKRRESYLDEITKAFIQLHNERTNITPATLVTAAAANAALKAEVISLLKQKFGKGEVDLATGVDDSLIGGFILRFDDKLYDSSVRSQLIAIKKELQSTTFSKN